MIVKRIVGVMICLLIIAGHACLVISIDGFYFYLFNMAVLMGGGVPLIFFILWLFDLD